MTPEALALRPAVEALHKAGIRTGDDYDRLVEQLIGHIYAVPDDWATCRHCREPIVPCPNPSASVPICKGWRHASYSSDPIGAHYCGGRSVHPSAEPADGEQ